MRKWHPAATSTHTWSKPRAFTFEGEPNRDMNNENAAILGREVSVVDYFPAL